MSKILKKLLENKWTPESDFEAELNLKYRLTEDERESFEERAGIMEFHGGRSRKYAEDEALNLVLAKRKLRITSKVEAA